MQVTKLTADQIGVAPKKHQYTQEEMQREYDYIRAEQLTRKLLNEGMIMAVSYTHLARYIFERGGDRHACEFGGDEELPPCGF